MSVCRICLKPLTTAGDYHPRCLRELFGTAKAPRFDVETGKLHTAALAMIGHTSLSGIQKKISVNLAVDRETLQVAAEGGQYILKPQTETYPALPENEHVTTRLAGLVGIETAPHGLVSLRDDSLAYVVRRFDRLPDGRKLRQEDFCQLAEQSPKQKYEGSAELCARLVRRFASEPLVELLKLYRLLVFGWWSGNGDLHLKNLSLLVDETGVVKLTRAYDLLSTRLVIADDKLALPIDGRNDRLSRSTWLKLAEYCGLPEKPALRVLARQAASLPEARRFIERSFLPPDQQADYEVLIAERSAALR